MALTTPITRDIVVSEKRNYVLTYSFCELGVTPSAGDIIAKAFPRFTYDAFFIGFLGSSSPKPVRKMFAPGDKLWRRTGSKVGRFDEYSAEYEFPVATEIQDAAAINLPFSISEGTLSVTIPFGASFSRVLSETTGIMSTDDMYAENDPATYVYAVVSKGVSIGSGYVNITIDLAAPVVDANAAPTVCSTSAIVCARLGKVGRLNSIPLSLIAATKKPWCAWLWCLMSDTGG